MDRTRYTVALAAALVVAAGGCSKDRRTSTSENEAPGAVTGRYATPGPVARAATRAVDVSIFPKDTEALISIRVSDFAKGPLAKALNEMRSDNDIELAQIKTLCKLDPFRDVHVLTVGGSFSGGERGAVLVQGSFSQAKVNGCIKKLAKKHKAKVTVRKEGAITVYKSDSDTFYAAWLGAGTVLAGTDREHLNELLARKSSVNDNIKLGEVLREADHKASAWAASLMPQEFAAFRVVGNDVQMHAGYLNLLYKKGGLQLNLGVLTGSKQQAQRASKKLQELLKTLGPSTGLSSFASGGVKVGTKGSFATASLAISKEELAKALAMLKDRDKATAAKPKKAAKSPN